VTKSTRIAKIKKCDKNCVLSTPTDAPNHWFAPVQHQVSHAPVGLTDRWEGGGFIRGVRKRWVRGQGGCKHGWEGEGGWWEGLFLTLFISCVILTVCDTHASPGNTRATRYRGGPNKATTLTRGRCPTSSNDTKGRWAPAVSSSLLLSWLSPSCPGHGCLNSSSSGGDISGQARAGAGGAGRFPGTARVIHYLPLKQHIRHSCSAAAVTNVS